MSLSISNNARNLFASAQDKASNAAVNLAKLPAQSSATSAIQSNSQSSTQDLVNLKESEIEAKTAAKLLATDKQISGSLLDVLA
ncbi:MAG: hypothetical protein WC782_01085 [Methylococcaceae bacterium]|jgi:hypothetical protein